MKIGVDLDNVLSQSMKALIEFHNDTYGTTQKIEDYTTPNFEEVWGGSFEMAIKKIFEFHKTPRFKNIEPVVGAKEVLDKLKKDNELVIITARAEDIKESTEQWINKNYPNIFSKIYYTNGFTTDKKEIPKKKICDDIGIDILIEDNLANILDCMKPGRKAFLFDYPWNQTDKLPCEVTRVHSWKEIGEEIN